MKKYIFKYLKDGEQIEFVTTDHIKAMGAAAAFISNCSFSMDILETQIPEEIHEQ